MQKELVNVKMVEVFISMMERMGNGEVEGLVGMVRVMGIVKEELDQKVREKCERKLLGNF